MMAISRPPTWILEPGHTGAEFRARHMMLTWVRGLFKDIHGTLEFDADRCLDTRFAGEIAAAGVWTGEPQRDEHLRSADFLDVARFDSDRSGEGVLERVGRDVRSATASGEVRGTPTLFVDGVVHRAGYDVATLLGVLAG